MYISVFDGQLNKIGLLDNKEGGSLTAVVDGFERFLESGSGTIKLSIERSLRANETRKNSLYEKLDESTYLSIADKDRDYFFTTFEYTKHNNKKEFVLESLNLELINETTGTYEAKEDKTIEQYFKVWAILDQGKMKLGKNELKDKKMMLKFDKIESVLKRVLSIIDSFGGEVDFVTETDDFGKFKQLTLDIYKKKDDKNKGVGKKRDRIIKVADNLDIITKKVTKRELYNALTIVGTHEVKKTENQLVQTTKKGTAGASKKATYNEGALVYAGHQLKKETINSILELCLKFNLLPSGIIVQVYLESFWGDSRVGRTDNNWSGMSGTAQTRPSGIVVTTGSRRPPNEGGTYFHYKSVADWLYDYMYLLRPGGIYAVSGKKDFGSYIKGLFTIGGARANYAQSGYNLYVAGANSIRAGIERSNPGKLDKIDNLWRNPQTVSTQVATTTGASKDNRVEKMIQWMESKKGRVTYSMAARTGPSSYDCSSAVYYAMQAGGFGGIGTWPFSTESEHAALTAAGYKLIAENKPFTIQRGDIIIWGRKGYSAGVNCSAYV